jgi:probable rRNA maturation factor
VNRVDVSLEGFEDAPWVEEARVFALTVLERLAREDWDLSLLFCDDAFIRELNRQYRDRDEATDVLSFAQGTAFREPSGAERFLAGDVVISLETLARSATDFDVSREEELKRLILHGILHLSGMDHEDNDPERPMLVFQEKMLADLRGRGGATR